MSGVKVPVLFATGPSFYRLLLILHACESRDTSGLWFNERDPRNESLCG